MLGTYHLTALYDLVKGLHFLYETDRIFTYLLENITKTMDSDSASLYVSDPAREVLKLKACLGPKKSIMEMIAEETPFPFGEGIAGWCAKFNQPAMIENVQNEPRFNSRWDKLTGYKTKSVLAAPISNKDDVLGVIEVLNKKGTSFNQNDQDLITAIAKQTAIALENGRLHRELTYARNFAEGMISNMTGGMIAIDANGKITHMNPPAENTLKLMSFECVGQPAPKALEKYPSIAEKLSEALKTKEKQARKEMSCKRSDKTILTLGYSTFPIEDKSKGILGAGIIFRDLAALPK